MVTAGAVSPGTGKAAPLLELVVCKAGAKQPCTEATNRSAARPRRGAFFALF